VNPLMLRREEQVWCGYLGCGGENSAKPLSGKRLFSQSLQSHATKQHMLQKRTHARCWSVLLCVVRKMGEMAIMVSR
jgi:hypothetical protein